MREKKKFFFFVFFSCFVVLFLCLCVVLFVVVVDFFFCLCNDEKQTIISSHNFYSQKNLVSLSTPRIHYIILEEKSRERDERDERDERVFCCTHTHTLLLRVSFLGLSFPPYFERERFSSTIG